MPPADDAQPRVGLRPDAQEQNATGRVTGNLTLLNRHAYRWDMPEAQP